MADREICSAYMFRTWLEKSLRKIKFEKIFENYSRLLNNCGGLENSLKFKKRGVGIRVRD